MTGRQVVRALVPMVLVGFTSVVPLGSTGARTVNAPVRAVRPGGHGARSEHTVLNGALNGVYAASAQDAWAVGVAGHAGSMTPLALHWDGSSWQRSFLGHLPTNTALTSVSGSSRSDVWAVGKADSGAVGLILHWDGSSWHRIRQPNLRQVVLYSVVSISADDAWAVGDSWPTGGAGAVFHWNGTHWRPVTYPAGSYFSVAAGGPDDVWAVGFTRTGKFLTTVTSHWDGQSWTQIPSPDPDSVQNMLQGVTALPDGQAWATGWYGNDRGGLQDNKHGNQRSLILNWTGTTWTVVRHTEPDPYINDLAAVTAIAPGDVWGVGYAGSEPRQNVTDHWHGTTWTPVMTPSPTEAIGLNAVSAKAADDVWAVGGLTTATLHSKTWIEHWDGQAWQQF